MEVVYYFLPRAIQYAAYFASLVFLVLLCTRIRSFAALAVLTLLTHIYSLFITPFIARFSGPGHIALSSTWIYMVLAVLGAIAFWRIYVHMRPAEA